MLKIQEKLKNFLLLSDADAALLLRGDFKALLMRNKEAFIRVAVCYGIVFAAFLLYLAMFSVFGVMMKLSRAGVLIAVVGAAVYALGAANVVKATRSPAILYFLLLMFGMISLSMLSEVTGNGSFISELFALLVFGGLAYGVYMVRGRAAKMGCSLTQMIAACLIVTSFTLSVQAAFIQFGVEREIAFAKQREEARRLRDAENMRRSMAESKPCTNDEECKKMNTKKNSYYAEHEEVAQEICEQAVSKEIPDRFEWTVGAKEYKFTSYQVDVLQDLIVLMGDRAQLIDRNGIRTKLNYSCKFNVKRKTATATVVK